MPRHCEEPTGPARSGRPDARLRDEAIQRGNACQLRCPTKRHRRTGLLRLRLAMTTKEKRKRNADRRVCPTSAPYGRGAHPCLFPLPRVRGRVEEGARSPIGVPRRLLPSGLSALGRSSRPGFLGRGRTFDPVRSPQPGSKDLALLHGRYPRPPVPVQGMHLPDRS